MLSFFFQCVTRKEEADMKNIRAFVNGVIEFRLTYTTSYECIVCSRYYEAGRSIAHKITFHKFDPC